MSYFKFSGVSQLLCLSLSLCSPSLTLAAVVRHTLKATDQPFKVQTQSTCGTYLLQPGPHWCNPALFVYTKDSVIKGDLAINADQNAYETTDHLLNRPIDQAFVETLFRENDFQSFSGLARLEAVNSYVSFSYTPVYAVGAYKLSNPNLPEVDAAAVRESQFRLTSGVKLWTDSNWTLTGGASVFLFDRRLYYIHANALEIIVRDINSLLTVEEKRSLDADYGLHLLDESHLFPALGLVLENFHSPQTAEITGNRVLALEPNLRRKSRLESGYTFIHSSGSYSLGIALPFWDAFRVYDRLATAGSLTYGIGRLRVFSSFSPLMSSFGFLFMSNHYHVGIQYTNDKQDNSLELRRRKNVNLFMATNF